MERFKGHKHPEKSRQCSNLHSNMERFKVNISFSPKKLASHLHSNMERFKDRTCIHNYCTDLIYIPIWRDLKTGLAAWRKSPARIYIPIWRDLKCGFQRLPLCGNTYLHSNMERFKVYRLCLIRCE